MSFPAINNSMKGVPVKPSKTANTGQNAGGMQSFGLGIQVFKIQSSKDTTDKSKNRNNLKQFQNPKHTTSTKITPKQPTAHRPKVLPRIQNSPFQQRVSNGYSTQNLNNRTTDSIHSSDKYIERSEVSVNSINKRALMTPHSLSREKRHAQEAIKKRTTEIPSEIRQRPVYKDPSKLKKINNQPPAPVQYKANEVDFSHSNEQNNRIPEFQREFQSALKTNIKEAKGLKRLKQNDQNQQVLERIGFLQSTAGAINRVLQAQDQALFQRFKANAGGKSSTNTIVPVLGFHIQKQLYDEFGIDSYKNGQYSGSFIENNYESVDLMPITTSDMNNEQ